MLYKHNSPHLSMLLKIQGIKKSSLSDSFLEIESKLSWKSSCVHHIINLRLPEMIFVVAVVV